MILANFFRIDVEKILKYSKLAIYGSIALCLFGSIVSGISFSSFSETKSFIGKKINNGLPASFDFESIGSGAMALNGRKKSSLIPDLSREIIFLAKSTRPDRITYQGSLLLKTKDSEEMIVLDEGQQIFLECSQKQNEEPVYKFTNQKTPLWIRPISSGRGDLSVEVGLFSAAKQNEGFFEEISQLLLQQANNLSSKSKNLSPFLKSLNQAKWWGSDMLIKKYGGAEYSGLLQKQKIEIPSQNDSSFFYLSPGDYLQWRNNSWVPISLENSDGSAPLAKIKNIIGKVLEIEVWDENGFYPQVLKFEQQPIARVNSKNDVTASSLRLRSSSQVTCSLGKKRFILKEGDWLIKTGKTWRNLKRSRDIDDCINHKIKGDLFIFDYLEKHQGKLVMKGHFFDEMRTNITEISIPVSSEEVSQSTRKKTKMNPFIQKKVTAGGKNET